MVFSRKQESAPSAANNTLPEKRTSGQSVIAHAHHASANSLAESVIGNDLSIEGETITIRCKGSLRVNGDIQADLHSQELEVGREGRITGSIAANTVNVFGHVSGAIQGSRVILHATAEVDGDIHSGNLAIESGASFDGRSRKAHDPEEIRPILEKQGGGAEQATPVAQFSNGSHPAALTTEPSHGVATAQHANPSPFGG
ncbi:MAG: polymer-forming cytoskeletal protein [Alphaproteobacteria bacterium]|nr:polymer-forming cytoskeletal protein [Alphaproteobacteria bacterium]